MRLPPPFGGIRACVHCASRRPAVLFLASEQESSRKPMGIKNVSADSFDTDVLKSDVPVLVDFWAEWCGPCKLIAPILDEVSHDYADRMAVAKVNVDESQAIAAKYGIRGIPTLMLFKNGTLVGTKVGAVSKGQLTAFLDSNL